MNKTNVSAMKGFKILPPRSGLLLGALAVLALLLTLFVYVEVTQSRTELLENIRAEAGILVETLNRGGETTITANDALEDAFIDRLIVTALLIDHMEQHETLTQKWLAAQARELGVHLILLSDAQGNITASSTRSSDTTARSLLEYPGIRPLLEPVLTDRYVWTAEDDISNPWTGETLFLLVHERRTSPGAVLVGYSSSALLDVRKRLGIGQLAQRIGHMEGITYVVLQDENGILTASRGVQEMNAIADDDFLAQALRQDSTRTRFHTYGDASVFEVVQRMDIEGDRPVLTRIGLSLDRVQNIQQRSMRRTLFIAIGFFITAFILLTLLMTRQRYTLLTEEHQKVRTSTAVVLDNIADAVVATDSAGVITVFNTAAERLLGRTAESAIGQPHTAVIPADSLLLARTHEERKAVDYAETDLHAIDGDRRVIAVSTSIIPSPDGGIDTAISIARDITEQRRIREQLHRRDRLAAMGELAGGIAHEIRNPLNAITIIAQRFHSEFVPTEDIEEYRQLSTTIRSEVRRVNGIITQFLEFARPPKLTLRKNSLTEILRDSVDVIRSQARAKSVRLHLMASEELAIDADREKLQQVFLNLLQNALDALPKGGEIKCIACRSNDRIMLSIADNGPGIPEEMQSKIFNLYFTTKTGGTGLGLSIVHQIVSEHGGEISVTSHPGQGTTFRILLPPASEIRHDD